MFCEMDWHSLNPGSALRLRFPVGESGIWGMITKVDGTQPLRTRVVHRSRSSVNNGPVEQISPFVVLSSEHWRVDDSAVVNPNSSRQVFSSTQ